MAFLQFFALLILLIVPLPVQAQDINAPSASPENPYADYPQELLDNAELVYQNCKNDDFDARHYDCRCRALAYLDQSIHFPPGTPVDNVLFRMGNNCPNRVEMAGSAYSDCLTGGVMMNMGDRDPEAFCACYGRQYADNLAQYEGTVDTRLIVAARSHAIRSCRRAR